MSLSDDNKELNELLTKTDNKPRFSRGTKRVKECSAEALCDPLNPESKEYGILTQWTTGDGKKYAPAGITEKFLPPGVYEINQSSCIGLYFEKIPVRTEGLIRFPQTNSELVLKEIEKFWDKEKIFKEYDLAYKRGIILYGPPGGGKTCTVNLIMKDVVDRSGVVIKFTHPALFIEGMRIIREIQPTTPIVILMEDVDAILENYEESPVLNILDGVENISKVVFLATTNYPEVLGARIINRPSRFDKRFKIPYPDAESRKMYFMHLCGSKSPQELKIDIKKWVKDTEDFSIAHLKELFVAVIILGDTYEEALDNLNAMKEKISSYEDFRNMGFKT